MRAIPAGRVGEEQLGVKAGGLASGGCDRTDRPLERIADC